MQLMERVYTLNDIDVVARELLASCGVPHSEHAMLWALKGDLGVGKTTLVQALARALGVMETVTSPTFILEKVYGLKDQAFKRLVHIDAYRFERPEEIEVLGWKNDLILAPENLIVLEWPERVAALLPQQTQFFELAIIDENTRRLSYGHKT